MFDEFIVALFLTALDSCETEQTMRLWEEITKHVPKNGILAHRYFGTKLFRSACMLYPEYSDPNDTRWKPYVWDATIDDGLGNWT